MTACLAIKRLVQEVQRCLLCSHRKAEICRTLHKKLTNRFVSLLCFVGQKCLLDFHTYIHMKLILRMNFNAKNLFTGVPPQHFFAYIHINQAAVYSG